MSTEFTLTSKLGKTTTYSVEGVGYGVGERDYEFVKIGETEFSLSDLMKAAGVEVTSEWFAKHENPKRYRIRITIESEPVE